MKDRFGPPPPPQTCSGSAGSSNPSQGNPIYPVEGVKRQVVSLGVGLGEQSVDLLYDSARSSWGYDQVNGPFLNPGQLSVYPGETPSWGQLGKLWFSNAHRRLVISPNGVSIQAQRGQGTPTSFNLSGNQWISSADVRDRLVGVSGGYRLSSPSALSQETYDAAGLLTVWQSASGLKLLPTYSTASTPASVAPAAGYLLSLSDPFGRSISFTYTTLSTGDVAIASVTDAAGQRIALGYEGGNLVSLSWPDGSVRRFVYDSPHVGQPWALTGIIDELNKRYASFTYDPSGWARSTEHAGGVDKFEVSYSRPPQPLIREEIDTAAQVVWRYHEWLPPDGTTVTQPNGASVSFAATAVMGASAAQGAIRSTGSSQPAGAGCSASSNRIDYDQTTGHVLLRDDFNGKRVCYSHDTQGREASRVEGLMGGGSGADCTSALAASNLASFAPEARKVSTQWHPDWDLPTRRAEPGKFTTWVYNGQVDPYDGGAVASCAPASAVLPDGQPIAVLCKVVEQATQDASGAQGFMASPDANVALRTTRYTYNPHGQMLTQTDARGYTTTYSYYSDTTASHTMGDLWQVTNAKGHVTEYTQYNRHGQVLQSKDPNGVISSYTYDLRQRLKSATVAGETTSIDYWPTGLLKQVTRPDGSSLSYTYDEAHRLTDVTDNLGQRVHYTLDNAGNRLKEEVQDPSGSLLRQIDREYDALNRLYKITGALQ